MIMLTLLLFLEPDEFVKDTEAEYNKPVTISIESMYIFNNIFYTTFLFFYL